MAIEKRKEKETGKVIGYRSVIYGGNRKKIARSKWFKKESLAKEWERKYYDSAVRKELRKVDCNADINELLDLFIYERKRCSPKNEKDIRYILTETFKAGNIDKPKDWTRNSALIFTRSKENVLAPRTHRKYKIYIFAFSKFLTGLHYFEEDPLKNATKPASDEDLPDPNKPCLNLHEINLTLGMLDVKKKFFLPLAIFLADTACRLNEGVYLEWDDVDLDERLVIIRPKPKYGITCKWGSARKIPMSKRLKDCLSQLPRKSNFIFLNPVGTIWKNNVQRDFRKIMEDLAPNPSINSNITIKRALDITPHTYRHSRITIWLDSGVPLRTVMEWAGHRSIKTTMKYLHMTRTHQQNVQLLDDTEGQYQDVAI